MVLEAHLQAQIVEAEMDFAEPRDPCQFGD